MERNVLYEESPSIGKVLIYTAELLLLSKRYIGNHRRHFTNCLDYKRIRMEIIMNNVFIELMCQFLIMDN